MKSKVTIIMATYNRAHFIVETLLSIKKQTCSNWECLIIDDGGTDNTEEVITSILEEDPRFSYLKRPDTYKKGLPGSRNYGLDSAKGDYIIFFDDDDIVHPDNLKICVEILESEFLNFCHYQKSSFKDKKPIIEQAFVNNQNSLSKVDIEKIVTQEIGLASCTVMWKKKCFSTIRFNENLLYAEEWECYTRIVAEGFNGIIIDAVLYYNRKHSASNTAEFYNDNPIRRASKKEAIVLILENLKEKKILTNSIVKHFVTQSLGFKEFYLFNQIMRVLDLNIFQRLNWELYIFSYPLRMSIYKMKKSLNK